jgi:UDP-N-acetylmuramate dehydrogenase
VPAGRPVVGDKEAAVLRLRRKSVPSGASAGCVFKNPPGQPAYRYIREAGCAGLSRGGAVISRRHANFIVNRGGATSADIRELVRRVEESVREKSGVRLEPEIRIVGEFE